MGLLLRCVTGEVHPENIVGRSPSVIINDMDPLGKFNSVDRFIITEVTNELDIVPSCACGELSDFASTGIEGKKCGICGTEVTNSYHKPLEPLLFLRKPIGIKKLLLPNAWSMIDNAFSKKRYSVLEYITNTNYKVDRVTKKEIEDMGIERGYNYFIDNIDFILNTLSKAPTYRNRKSVKYLMVFYEQNKDKIYTDYIPFPNRCLGIIENTAMSSYLDINLINLMDAARIMVGIDKREFNDKQLNNITGRLMAKFNSYYKPYLRKLLAGREGAFRSSALAAKGVFSSRLITTSITDVHDYEYVELPYIACLSMLKMHIISVMLNKHKMRIRDIYAKLHHAAYNFSEFIYGIINDLLNSANGKMLRAIVQRFPTLSSSSLGSLKFRAKDDVYDLAISYPITIVRGTNTDFDGDGLHVTLMLDMLMSKAIEPLEYHYNIINKTIPRTLNGNMSLSKPVVTNLSKWLQTGFEVIGSDKQVKDMVEEFGIEI